MYFPSLSYVRKRKLLHMLDEICRYFAAYPEHSWRECDLDNGIYRDAEHKDGESYDYGELTKIK